MIKDLIKLIKMLFQEKPSQHKEVKLIPMNSIPFKGYLAMMWCGNIIYRKENEEKIYRNLQQTMKHEGWHKLQAEYWGKDSWIRYYLIYLWEWIKGNPLTHPSKSAYYTIPFEVEAYALENKEPLEYDPSLLKSKYTLKNRKKIFRQHRTDWRNWVKNGL